MAELVNENKLGSAKGSPKFIKLTFLAVFTDF